MNADQNRLYQHVEFLTSLRPYRNYKNVESLRKAADYIEENMMTSGFSVKRQRWEAKENFYENVIASYQPEKSKRFVLGAHYDVYKEQQGADDNASSVAGLLEIGRLLKEMNPPLAYGIDLVAFCLEEPPFFKTKEMGSYIHASRAFAENQEIIGMIALEMIGYYRKDKKNVNREKNYLIVSGIKKYDAFNQSVSNALKQPGYLDSRRISYADDFRNNGPSDHRNYWPFGYPAVMVIGTGGEGNPNYHLKTDQIQTLNFDIMTQAVDSIFYAITHFDLKKEKPTR